MSAGKKRTRKRKRSLDECRNSVELTDSPVLSPLKKKKRRLAAMPPLFGVSRAPPKQAVGERLRRVEHSTTHSMEETQCPDYASVVDLTMESSDSDCQRSAEPRSVQMQSSAKWRGSKQRSKKKTKKRGSKNARDSDCESVDFSCLDDCRQHLAAMSCPKCHLTLETIRKLEAGNPQTGDCEENDANGWHSRRRRLSHARSRRRDKSAEKSAMDELLMNIELLKADEMSDELMRRHIGHCTVPHNSVHVFDSKHHCDDDVVFSTELLSHGSSAMRRANASAQVSVCMKEAKNPLADVSNVGGFSSGEPMTKKRDDAKADAMPAKRSLTSSTRYSPSSSSAAANGREDANDSSSDSSVAKWLRWLLSDDKCQCHFCEKNLKRFKLKNRIKHLKTCGTSKKTHGLSKDEVCRRTGVPLSLLNKHELFDERYSKDSIAKLRKKMAVAKTSSSGSIYTPPKMERETEHFSFAASNGMSQFRFDSDATVDRGTDKLKSSGKGTVNHVNDLDDLAFLGLDMSDLEMAKKSVGERKLTTRTKVKQMVASTSMVQRMKHATAAKKKKTKRCSPKKQRKGGRSAAAIRLSKGQLAAVLLAQTEEMGELDACIRRLQRYRAGIHVRHERVQCLQKQRADFVAKLRDEKQSESLLVEPKTGELIIGDTNSEVQMADASSATGKVATDEKSDDVEVILPHTTQSEGRFLLSQFRFDDIESAEVDTCVYSPPRPRDFYCLERSKLATHVHIGTTVIKEEADDSKYDTGKQQIDDERMHVSMVQRSMSPSKRTRHSQKRPQMRSISTQTEDHTTTHPKGASGSVQLSQVSVVSSVRTPAPRKRPFSEVSHSSQCCPPSLSQSSMKKARPLLSIAANPNLFSARKFRTYGILHHSAAIATQPPATRRRSPNRRRIAAKLIGGGKGLRKQQSEVPALSFTQDSVISALSPPLPSTIRKKEKCTVALSHTAECGEMEALPNAIDISEIAASDLGNMGMGFITDSIEAVGANDDDCGVGVSGTSPQSEDKSAADLRDASATLPVARDLMSSFAEANTEWSTEQTRSRGLSSSKPEIDCTPKRASSVYCENVPAVASVDASLSQSSIGVREEDESVDHSHFSQEYCGFFNSDYKPKVSQRREESILLSQLLKPSMSPVKFGIPLRYTDFSESEIINDDIRNAEKLRKQQSDTSAVSHKEESGLVDEKKTESESVLCVSKKWSQSTIDDGSRLNANESTMQLADDSLFKSVIGIDEVTDLSLISSVSANDSASMCSTDGFLTAEVSRAFDSSAKKPLADERSTDSKTKRKDGGDSSVLADANPQSDDGFDSLLMGDSILGASFDGADASFTQEEDDVFNAANAQQSTDSLALDSVRSTGSKWPNAASKMGFGKRTDLSVAMPVTPSPLAVAMSPVDTLRKQMLRDCGLGAYMPPSPVPSLSSSVGSCTPNTATSLSRLRRELGALAKEELSARMAANGLKAGSKTYMVQKLLEIAIAHWRKSASSSKRTNATKKATATTVVHSADVSDALDEEPMDECVVRTLRQEFPQLYCEIVSFQCVQFETVLQSLRAKCTRRVSQKWLKEFLTAKGVAFRYQTEKRRRGVRKPKRKRQ